MLKWARRLVHRLGTGDQASAGQSSSAGQAARGGRTVADPSPGPVGLAAVTARPDDLRAAPDDGSSELHKPRPSGNTQPDVPGAEPRVGTKDQIDFDEEWYLSATLTSHERCRKGGARQASNIILATGGLKVACPCHQTVGSASDHQCPNLVPRTGSRRCRATIRRRSATSGDWYDDTDAKPQTCRVWPHARSSAVRPGGLRPQTAGGDTSLIDWLSKPIEALLS